MLPMVVDIRLVAAVPQEDIHQGGPRQPLLAAVMHDGRLFTRCQEAKAGLHKLPGKEGFLAVAHAWRLRQVPGRSMEPYPARGGRKPVAPVRSKSPVVGASTARMRDAKAAARFVRGTRPARSGRPRRRHGRRGSAGTCPRSRCGPAARRRRCRAVLRRGLRTGPRSARSKFRAAARKGNVAIGPRSSALADQRPRAV